MSRKICPNCGTAQPNNSKTCVSCGHELDTGEPYAGKPKFVKPMWFNIAAVFVFLSTIGTIVVMGIFQRFFGLWAVVLWEVVIGFGFIFPTKFYRFFSRRYYFGKLCTPDDYDEPERSSIIVQTIFMFIVWGLMVALTILSPILS